MITLQERRKKNKLRMKKNRQNEEYRNRENERRRKSVYAYFFDSIDNLSKIEERYKRRKIKQICFEYNVRLWLNGNIPLTTIDEYRKKYYQQPEIKQKMNEYMKGYYQRPEEKEKRKKYAEQYYKLNKSKLNKYGKNYYINNKENQHNYYLSYYIQNKDDIQIKQRYYIQTEQGKINIRDYMHKRQEVFKYIPLMPNIFPEDIKIDYHHLLNDFYSEDRYSWFIIPMPRITHRYIGGKTTNKEHWRHNAEWIKRIYCIDIKQLLKP